MTNGLALGFIFMGIRSDFLNFIQLFDENSLNRQKSPRWNATGLYETKFKGMMDTKSYLHDYVLVGWMVGWLC